MARVRDDFEGVVYARVNGVVKAFAAGDVIPEDIPVGGHVAATVAVGEPLQDAQNDATREEPGEPEPEYPGDDATREELNAYAAAIGLNPESFKNKGDLVVAIHDATEEVDEG